MDESRKDMETNEDFFDENSNLFTSNMNNVNNELSIHKGKLKSIKNSLADLPSYRVNTAKVTVQNVVVDVFFLIITWC